jgi:hypothetical protein
MFLYELIVSSVSTHGIKCVLLAQQGNRFEGWAKATWSPEQIIQKTVALLFAFVHARLFVMGIVVVKM